MTDLNNNANTPQSDPAVIAVLMPGDMGHAVGRALREHGHLVITNLEGRGPHSHQLAAEAGLQDVGSLEVVVREADIILSILPPANAVELAASIAKEMRTTDRKPVYVDCNAISPDTAREAAAHITGADGHFIDCGIIGLAPGIGNGPRFYVSGDNLEPMIALNGKGFEVIPIGPNIGEASSLKMVYAGLTKGTWTLHTAVLMAAKRLGVLDPLLAEFERSQSATLKDMRGRTPFLPADSGRWVGEMEEIAATFASAGVSDGFHKGAASVFRVLAKTPFALETRQTLDRSRTLEQALDAYVQHLDSETKG